MLSLNNNRIIMAFNLFEYLNENNIVYTVVGDTDDYSSSIDSDVDIVISPKDLTRISEILSTFCRMYNYNLILKLQHEITAIYFVIADFNDKENIIFLHPDICSDYIRNGRKFISANNLLSGRQRSVVNASENKYFYVPSPAYEFIYYLIKKIDKGDLTNSGATHLQSQWEQDKEAASGLVRTYWKNATDSQLIEKCAHDKNWGAVKENINHLRKALSNSNDGLVLRLLLELKRKASRFIYPTGVLVAFFGPDGSGKTSVIHSVDEILADVFRKTHNIHLRPKLGHKHNNNTPIITDPHNKPTRGRILSLLKLLYLAFDYIAGYLAVVRPMLVRSTLVLFDRYYHDILVDPTRYRHNCPIWITRLVEKLIPRPDLLILLDAPAEVLQSRKQEVSFEETARQREAYRAVLSKYPECIIINSNQPLELVVADATKAILEYLDQRYKKNS